MQADRSDVPATSLKRERVFAFLRRSAEKQTDQVIALLYTGRACR